MASLTVPTGVSIELTVVTVSFLGKSNMQPSDDGQNGASNPALSGRMMLAL